MPRADGPFKVLQRVIDNAYYIELPKKSGISTTFNASNLSLIMKMKMKQIRLKDESF